MKVQSTDFYSQSSNFLSSVSGGVDPRTGLYNINLPLTELQTDYLTGPAFSLHLGYNPLSEVNNGFGAGFSLGLSYLDTNTGRLQLSTGEQYQVNTKSLVVKQKKINNFILKKIDDTHCQIIYKSGQIENLSLFKGMYRPSLITSPDGKSLKLIWSSAYKPARLVRAEDGNGNILCRVSYPDNQVSTTRLSILPADSKTSYDLIFRFTNELLISVTNNAVTPALVWKFGYEDVGPAKDYRVITGFTSPTGMEEKVSYYTDSGMAFPETAGLSPLPCVYKHTLKPGNNQPHIITQWSWTQKNYLGKDAGLNLWQPDNDQMLAILLIDYSYGSTAKSMDADGKTVLSTVVRSYNSYHLQLSEITSHKGKIHKKETQYNAKPGKKFDDQPAEYALPVSQTEIWDDNSGAPPRVLITQTLFDKEGNILYEKTPDGTVTEFIYYPADGEIGLCPPEPHGFTRYLKNKKIIPRQIFGDEYENLTEYTWKKLSAPDESGYSIVEDFVTQTTGTVRTISGNEYYDDIGNSTIYGRKKTEKTTLVPDISKEKSFTTRKTFTYSMNEQSVTQTETVVTYDNLTISYSTERHASLGYLLSEINTQNITTVYSYDKLGRIQNLILAPGSVYENTTSWSYSIENNVPVTTVIYASGNQTKTYFDGSGRAIKRQDLDTDKTGEWFEVSKQNYNSLGQVASVTSNDWLTGSHEQYQMQADSSYDGWGAVSSQMFTDGTDVITERNPVTLSQITSMRNNTGGTLLNTGKHVATYNEQNFLPLTRARIDTTGRTDGTTHYDWDGLGQLRTETDEQGHVTTRTYDYFGRVLTQTLPDGSQVSRTYAPHLTGDNVATISVTGRNTSGQIQTWPLGEQEFDGLGRLKKTISGGRTITYSYDGASAAPSIVITPSGKIMEYRYIPELGGAVSSITTEGIKQTFSYDALTGMLLTMQEADVKNHNEWSPSGILKAETFLQDNESRRAFQSCTLSGKTADYTDISGKQTIYARDSYGRIISIKDGELTAALQYDRLGRLHIQKVTSQSAQSQLITTFSYDDFGRVISQTLESGRNFTLNISQTWEPNGLLASRTTTQNDVLIKTERYVYDKRNRLTEYYVSGDNLPRDAYNLQFTAQTFSYDALNNLGTVSTVLADGSSDTATFHYGNISDPAQLTKITHTHTAYPHQIVLEYDRDGRMIRDESNKTLNYDVTGRLVSISDNIHDSSYKYDAQNRLVSQSVSDGDTHQLYYRGDQLVNEVLVRQRKELRFIRAGHTCLGVGRDNAVTLTAGDHNNSLLWSKNDSQKEGKLHTWSPYGNGETTEDLPGFNGERTDPVSGVYHLGNGYRAYNPILMRFNCPDSLSPFGEGGINPYTYCAGDPINNTDPSGHISHRGIAGIVTGVIGLAVTVATVGMSSSLSIAAIVAMTAGVAADVTSIASGALEDVSPEASSALGWASLALGVSAGLTSMGGARMLGQRGSYEVTSPRMKWAGVINSREAVIVSNGRSTSLFENQILKGADTFNVRYIYDGYTNNFRGMGEDALLAHGNKSGYLALSKLDHIGNRLEENGIMSRKVTINASYGTTASTLAEDMKDFLGIDLVTGKQNDVLHLVSCYGKRIGQDVADALGRPVKAYSKGSIITPMILEPTLSQLESPSFAITTRRGKYNPLRLFSPEKQAKPRVFYPK